MLDTALAQLAQKRERPRGTKTNPSRGASRFNKQTPVMTNALANCHGGEDASDSAYYMHSSLL